MLERLRLPALSLAMALFLLALVFASVGLAAQEGPGEPPSLGLPEESPDWVVTDEDLQQVDFSALELSWLSSSASRTGALAWGDVDNDGDLDLAVGVRGGPNLLYLNNRGMLDVAGPAWRSAESDNTTSLAWADVDGDGDLDLAVGNSPTCRWQQAESRYNCMGGENRLYRNNNGALIASAVWSSDEANGTQSLAWGDVDGDGDLDLAVANAALWEECDDDDPCSRAQDRLYENRNGRLFLSDAWQPPVGNTYALAWGDYDGQDGLDLAINSGRAMQLYASDGAGNLGPVDIPPLPGGEETGGASHLAWADIDLNSYLDLVVVSGAGLYVYYNYGGELAEPLSWGARLINPDIRSAALGDYNGDGYPDLALGSSCFIVADCPLVIYATYGGFLSPAPAWMSEEDVNGPALAWADVDGDGDLDLAAGSGAASDPIRIYTNASPLLIDRGSFTELEVDATSVAWGDVDNDGDLDLALARPGFGRVTGTLALFLNEDGELSEAEDWQPQTDKPTSLAWGDVDGDGFLDLAVGNESSCLDADDEGRPACEAGRDVLFMNDAGALDDVPSWLSEEADNTQSVAWADVDADGDLDLAVGNGLACVFDESTFEETCRFGANRLYLNEGQQLAARAAWSSEEEVGTSSLAWGDVDADGDLDLAVGNEGQFIDEIPGNHLYVNDGGMLTTQAVWVSAEGDQTTSVAWGDADGDGDLDLAVGNSEQSARIYYNAGGWLMDNFLWTARGCCAYNVTWGDVDGDGDLDLAVNDIGGRVALHLNDAGYVNPVPNAFEDWFESGRFRSAWGDVDSDGDLDLAVGTQLFANQRSERSGYASTVTAQLARPATTGDAAYFSVPHILSNTIPLSFSLVNHVNRGAEQAQMRLKGYYSLDGGGYWLPAQGRVEAAPCGTDAATGVETTSDSAAELAIRYRKYRDPETGRFGTLFRNLVAGRCYVFQWDTSVESGNGVMGRSDNVVFRLVALPEYRAQENQAAGPYIQAGFATDSFPYRVRGTLVRVYSGTVDSSNVISGAVVYRLPKDEVAGAQPLGTAAGVYQTDAQGYLQGRGDIAVGDVLYALRQVDVDLPISKRNYSYYHTSFTPTIDGIQAYTVTGSGEQQLVVSATNPLVLFDVDVSLEWDPRNDGTFLQDLREAFRRSSEVLYDVSNGQMALGEVRVHPDRENWLYSDVVVYANNSIRPRASQGGAVLTPTNDIDLLGRTLTNAYRPGQIRMGTAWDPFGESRAELTDDWWRALAHEFGHYLLFLPDNYLGVDDASGTIVGRDCQGSFMTNAYDDAYSEFLDLSGITPADWPQPCDDTIAARTTGRSDWETIDRFFEALNLNRPGETATIPGPATLPLNVTRVFAWDEELPSEVLPARNFDLRGPDGSLLAVPYGQAYLFKTRGTPDDITDDQVLLLGETGRSDRIKVRGASEGDRLCVLDARSQPGLAGCIPALSSTSRTVRLGEVQDWRPNIDFRQVTSRTLGVTVTLESLPGGMRPELQVQIIPSYDPPTTTQQPRSPYTSLLGSSTVFTREFSFDYPLFTGLIRVWDPNRISGSDTPVEAISQFFVMPQWGPNDRVGLGPNDRFGLGPNDRVGLGPNDRVGLGPNDRVGLGPNDRVGLGPNDRVGLGPNDRVGLGPNDRVGLGPNDRVGLGPNDRVGLGVDWRLAGAAPSRGLGANQRGLGAPLASDDGQVTVFNLESVLEDPGTASLQSLSVLPGVPPWLTPVGLGYRMVASKPLSRTIAFNYLNRDVPDGYEHPQTLHLYYSADNGETWERLPTYVDIEENLASAPALESGLYALMASVDIPLSAAGWNLVSFPVLETREVDEALLSISGVFSTVYGFDSFDSDNPWQVYDVRVPGWVNDLERMEFGRGYWIRVSQPITLQLAVPEPGSEAIFRRQGASVPAGFLDLPSPPAVFFGSVAGLDLEPGASVPVTATINGVVCGVGSATLRTGEDGVAAGEPTYVVKVLAADQAGAAGCGIPGRAVGFLVGSTGAIASDRLRSPDSLGQRGPRISTTSATWDNTVPIELDLRLPLATRGLTDVQQLVCRELVRNGSFEDGLGGWTLAGPPEAAAVEADAGESPDEDVGDGQWLALRPPGTPPGGLPGLEAFAGAYQLIQMPEDAVSSLMTLRHRRGAGAGTADYQQVRLQLLGDSVELLRSRASEDWQEDEYDLGAYLGQSMVLSLEVFSPAGDTWMLLDDVSVVACDTAPIFE